MDETYTTVRSAPVVFQASASRCIIGQLLISYIPWLLVNVLFNHLSATDDQDSNFKENIKYQQKAVVSLKKKDLVSKLNNCPKDHDILLNGMKDLSANQFWCMVSWVWSNECIYCYVLEVEIYINDLNLFINTY